MTPLASEVDIASGVLIRDARGSVIFGYLAQHACDKRTHTPPHADTYKGVCVCACAWPLGLGSRVAFCSGSMAGEKLPEAPSLTARRGPNTLLPGSFQVSEIEAAVLHGCRLWSAVSCVADVEAHAPSGHEPRLSDRLSWNHYSLFFRVLAVRKHIPDVPQ